MTLSGFRAGPFPLPPRGEGKLKNSSLTKKVRVNI